LIEIRRFRVEVDSRQGYYENDAVSWFENVNGGCRWYRGSVSFEYSGSQWRGKKRGLFGIGSGTIPRLGGGRQYAFFFDNLERMNNAAAENEKLKQQINDLMARVSEMDSIKRENDFCAKG